MGSCHLVLSDNRLPPKPLIYRHFPHSNAHKLGVSPFSDKPKYPWVWYFWSLLVIQIIHSYISNLSIYLSIHPFIHLSIPWIQIDTLWDYGHRFWPARFLFQPALRDEASLLFRRVSRSYDLCCAPGAELVQQTWINCIILPTLASWFYTPNIWYKPQKHPNLSYSLQGLSWVVSARASAGPTCWWPPKNPAVPYRSPTQKMWFQ